MYSIYKLVHNNKVVYVGRTKMTLERRRGVGYRWNKELQSILNECSMELLETTEDKNREKYWIKYHRDIGCKLFNQEALYNNKEYCRKYYGDNKDYFKKWQQENKDKIKISNKKSHEKNRENFLLGKKIWREKNREHIREKRREYYLKTGI